MKVSLSELQGYARLAARGLGLSAAHADALCKALVHFASVEIDWAEFTAAFEPMDSDESSERFRVLRDAPSLLDDLICDQDELHISNIDAVSVLNLYVVEAEVAFGCAITLRQEGSAAVLALKGSTTPRTEIPVRLDIPKTVMDRLNALAGRMYVPDSEASRRGGAGAGLSDND